MRRTIRSLAFVLPVLTWAPASAEPPPPAVIVLDGSGSMGGPLEGQTAVKFDMAREAVRTASAKAIPAASLGLMVAGHRRKGNCADIELVTPPAPGTAAAMMARLDRIGTVGKGPLVQALRDAAKTFPPGAAGSLVLIHDGPDNCRQDPCAAADAITKTNPKLAIHVITLSLDPAVAPVMSCLAKATGGKSFEAHNGEELTARLDEALTIAGVIAPGPVASKAAPAAEGPRPPEAPASTEGPSRIRLTASLNEGGTALGKPVSWRIEPAATPGQVIIEKTAATLTEPLPAGKYIAEAKLGLAAQRAEFDVAEKGETLKNLSLEAGTLKITARTSKINETLANPLVTVLETGTGRRGSGAQGDAVWLGRKTDENLILPAGQYLVEVADGQAIKEAALTLKAGSEASADFVMGTGRIELNTAAIEGGEPLDGVSYVIEADDPESAQGRREIARSASPRPSFLLPAGTYYATAELGAATTKERIAIGTGDVMKRVLVLGAGTLTLTSQFDVALAPAGTAVSYRVLRQAGSAFTEIAHTSADEPSLTLPAGRYQIEARLGALPLQSVAAADVTAGGTAKAVLKFEAAELMVKPATAGQPALARWDVRNDGGHVVLRAEGSEARSAFLTPGRYTLRSESGDIRRELQLDLRPGERRTIEPGAN